MTSKLEKEQNISLVLTMAAVQDLYEHKTFQDGGNEKNEERFVGTVKCLRVIVPGEKKVIYQRYSR